MRRRSPSPPGAYQDLPTRRKYESHASSPDRRYMSPPPYRRQNRSHSFRVTEERKCYEKSPVRRYEQVYSDNGRERERERMEDRDRERGRQGSYREREIRSGREREREYGDREKEERSRGRGVEGREDRGRREVERTERRSRSRSRSLVS
mmetsp:Transcript_22860/g.40418  ORF Transcript_22860/g.40418 Transcript_22860/m.40418 type:complete len:150 (-) Transcript_22860:230-679(-)